MKSNRLGELLVRNKLITDVQLAKALEDQKVQGGRLSMSLVKLGFLKIGRASCRGRVWF